MDGKFGENSYMDTLRRVNKVAHKLCKSPSPLWGQLDILTLCLRTIPPGMVIPTPFEMLKFLTELPIKCSQQFFKSVKVLMVIMTTHGQSFSHIMGYIVRMEELVTRSGIIYDDVPPPIPGMPAPRYSTERWKMLKNLYDIQKSQHTITMRYVLSSRDMMMTSSNARLGFAIRCIMHGSPPRLKLRTVSPGMLFGVLKNFLADAAKNKQSNYLLLMIDIFVQFYGLNPIMRNMLRNVLRNMLRNVLRKI